MRSYLHFYCTNNILRLHFHSLSTMTLVVLLRKPQIPEEFWVNLEKNNHHTEMLIFQMLIFPVKFQVKSNEIYTLYHCLSETKTLSIFLVFLTSQLIKDYDSLCFLDCDFLTF